MSEVFHNDGPEHWCGACRIDRNHKIKDLIVRCVEKGIITRTGGQQLILEIA